MLETSPTVRLPRPDELPNNKEVFKKLKDRENAKIVEGYILRKNATHALPFTFYAEININNSRLWQLFTALLELLPGNISFIYNLYEQQAIFSPYLDKKSTLSFIEKFKVELTQDCNLEFGLIFHTEDEFEEIFVSEAKYLKVWSNKEVVFEQIMKDFSLQKVLGLNFIDEFSKVVEPLTMFNKNARPTESVIEELDSYFNG